MNYVFNPSDKTPKVGERGYIVGDRFIPVVPFDNDKLKDKYTIFLVEGTKGAKELVSGINMINNGVTFQNGIMDFSADKSTLDFPITSNSRWLLNDFTLQVVATACTPSDNYPSLIASGDFWENNSMSLRFGNSGSHQFGCFWNGVGDPVIAGGYIQYDNTIFHHVVLCRSNNYMKIYVDGISVKQPVECVTQWNVASDNLIRLGALYVNDSKYHGKIKWVRVSNIVRYSGNFDVTELMEV